MFANRHTQAEADITRQLSSWLGVNHHCLASRVGVTGWSECRSTNLTRTQRAFSDLGVIDKSDFDVVASGFNIRLVNATKAATMDLCDFEKLHIGSLLSTCSSR